MYFRVLHDEVDQSMTYLLADLDGGEAVVVDPRGVDVGVLLAMLGEYHLKLRWVLRTHEHDASKPGEAEALRALLARPVQQGVPDPGVLAFGGEHLRAIATPGHTPGCLSFLWRDRLFCGDLFAMTDCPPSADAAAA